MKRLTLSERVITKCVESGDCLIWKGSHASDGTIPSIYVDGKTMSVRTALWLEMGRKLTKGHAIKPKCNEVDCVAPLHLESRNYRAIPKSVVAKAVTAKKMRARSKITEQLAAEIRASEMSAVEWAERLEVSAASIRDVRNYRRWVPTTTPFAGLLR